MRAVLDVNILVSALVAPQGAPARLLIAWREGDYELLVSPALLDEMKRVLAYPKLQRHIGAEDARLVTAWLRDDANLVDDPTGNPSVRSADPDDDYLLALAESEGAALVSGDRHLLDLADSAPIFTAAEFLARLDR